MQDTSNAKSGRHDKGMTSILLRRRLLKRRKMFENSAKYAMPRGTKSLHPLSGLKSCRSSFGLNTSEYRIPLESSKENYSNHKESPDKGSPTTHLLRARQSTERKASASDGLVRKMHGVLAHVWAEAEMHKLRLPLTATDGHWRSWASPGDTANLFLRDFFLGIVANGKHKHDKTSGKFYVDINALTPLA